MTVTVNVANGNSYVGILNHMIGQTQFRTSVSYTFATSPFNTVQWNLAFDFPMQPGGQTHSYGAFVDSVSPFTRYSDGSFHLYGSATNPNVNEGGFVPSMLFVSGTANTVTTFRTSNGDNLTVTDIPDEFGSINLFTAQPTSGLTSLSGFNINVIEWNAALSAWVNNGDLSQMQYLLDREQYDFQGAASFNTDTFKGGNLGDTIRGGGGNDFLYGNGGNDLIFGEGDNDQLFGGAGNDELNGGAGVNRLEGGNDNDTYILGTGIDTIVDTGGIDELRFTNASHLNWADHIFTGDVAGDTIDESQIERISGSGGDDEIAISTFSNKAVVIFGGNGNDNLAGGGQGDSIFAGSGNDVLGGRGGNDIFDGGEGDDQLYSDQGDDTLTGGLGNDYIDGGTNSDTVSFLDHYGAWSGGWTIDLMAQSATTRHPGSGQFLYVTETDTLVNVENVIGSYGTDSIYGDGVGNVLNGGFGADFMAGGLGNDSYYADNVLDLVSEQFGFGSDFIYASVSYTLAANTERLFLTGADNINATGLNGQVDVLTGNTGNNILNGLSGNDVMRGLQGNDTYIVDSSSDIIEEFTGYGTDAIKSTVSFTMALNTERLYLLGSATINGTGLNTGNDLIVGNNGSNILNGLGGSDTLTGGLGNDFFLFNTALNATTNRDTITDFNVAADSIQLENAIFTALGAATGVLASTMFKNLTTGGAVDGDDRILYNDATGALLYDSDGSGTTAAIQFATLSGSPTLFFNDFIVV